MDNKIQPLEIYTTTNINNHESGQEEYYTLDEQIDHNQSQQWKEESVVAELFHLAKTLVHWTTPKDHPTNRLEFYQRYYVDMP